MSYVIGQRLRFKKPLMTYYVGFETEVVGLDGDGDPHIRMPDGSRDTFFAKDLFDLADIVGDPATPVIAPTLRDQFAMAALTGMLNPDERFSPFAVLEYIATIASNAYLIADAMLTERERAK